MLGRTSILALAICASGLGACTHVEHDHAHLPPEPQEARRGPPPHAPAHGYRHKQHTHVGNVELVFDSGLGVYVVVGWPGHYWSDDRYYRWVEGGWLISTHLDGGWAACSSKRLPPGLAKKQAKHGNGNKKSHPASRQR